MPVRASQANPISDSNQVTSQSSLKNLQKELHNHRFAPFGCGLVVGARQSGLEVRPSQKIVPVKCFKDDGTLKRPVQVGTIPKIRRHGRQNSRLS
jgi:hypothetical protein